MKVLIADDHGIIRDGIRALLSPDPDIEVVGTAANGREAVELTMALKPDLIIMDVAMPELNGVEATRQLMKALPKLRIIALSVHSDHRYVNEMLRAGAAGYLLKDSVFDELRFAISAIRRGQAYLSPPVAHFVLNEYRQKPAKQVFRDSQLPPNSPLTNREREVLQLLAEGHTMRVIAERLCISIKTVETHRKQISDKLGIRTIIDLTKYAIREGITSG
jgi:DNA-binding NarL/FixJ family response regulator